jgi:cysteine desulfurase/selenocysteine lyase
VLFVRKDRMGTIKPARFGGGMVNKVEVDKVLLHQGPAALEAGTPNIEGVLGLGAAVVYLQRLGMERVQALLWDLEDYAWQRLSQIGAITFPFPRGPEHAPIFTFSPSNRDCDPRYIGRILSDAHGLAVNVGYQCAQPLYRAAQVPGAIRASFYLYNTRADVDQLADALTDLTPFLA